MLSLGQPSSLASGTKSLMKLKDKVVLITGSGSALGREIGMLFASEGAKVGINDVRLDGVTPSG